MTEPKAIDRILDHFLTPSAGERRKSNRMISLSRHLVGPRSSRNPIPLMAVAAETVGELRNEMTVLGEHIDLAERLPQGGDGSDSPEDGAP